MYVTRLPPLLWLILLVAPALTAPLRAHAGQPLLQAHHDLPDRDSAGAGVSAEPTAGPRDRGHYGTAASRRAALTARGRRVGGWPGRGLTAAPAAEEAADPAEDAAAVAAADEEADEEETMLPESKAADAADPLIEAGHVEEDAEVSKKAAAGGGALVAGTDEKPAGSMAKEGEKGGDKAAMAGRAASKGKAAQVAESILEPISARASGGDDEKAASGEGSGGEEGEASAAEGDGGAAEMAAEEKEQDQEEEEVSGTERVSLLESADDTAERVRATAASAVEHAKEASQTAAAEASRQAAWPRISVGAGVAALKAWLEENSLEDYDLSACLALVFAALLVARVMWIRVRQKRQRSFGSPSPSGRPSRWRFGLGANRASQTASPRPLAWHRSPGR